MEFWRRTIRTEAIRFSGGLGLAAVALMMTMPVAHAVTDAEMAAFSSSDQAPVSFQILIDGLLVIFVLFAMFVWVMSALRRARRLPELGVGLHTYGFTEGILLTLLLFVISQLIAIVIGCLPKNLHSTATA